MGLFCDRKPGRQPGQSRREGGLTINQAVEIVRQYGEREGRLYAKRASEAQCQAIFRVRRFRDSTEKQRFAMHGNLKPLVWPLFLQAFRESSKAGNKLYPYWFKRQWFIDGFVDGVWAERGTVEVVSSFQLEV